MLCVEGLEAAYRDSKVLFGVDFAVAAGEVVALLGRNGMGKTTTVRSVFGLLKPLAGRILLDGVDMTGRAPHVIAQRGLGLVPEGRQIFPTLTVEENLVATARRGKWRLGSVFDLFPALADRRRHKGNQLSGGEQQMLAIGRALMTNPRAIILDEATEGLAPLIVADIWRVIAAIRETGISTIVVDRNFRTVLAHTDRVLLLEKGRVALTGASGDFKNDHGSLTRLLGV
jgi:branched-chain amino acid transport system ATP-binding protein